MYSIEWRNRYWYCAPEMSKMKMNKLPSTRHASHLCVCVSLMHAQICQAITNTRLIYEWRFCAYSLIVARRCSFIFIGRELRGSFLFPLSPMWTHSFTSTLSMYHFICVSTLHIWKRIHHINNRVIQAREAFAWIFFLSIKLWLSSTLTPLNARANEFTSVKHMIRCIKLIER